MSKIKSLCGKCCNHCPEGFTVFTSDKKADKLTENFSFIKFIRSGVTIVGKTKRPYIVLKCDRLKEDGECESFPENAPAWCKIKD